MTDVADKIAIVELHDLRAELSIDPTDTSFDERLRRIAGGVSAAVETHCNRVILARDLSAQKYDGDGTDELHLGYYPVISVTSLVNDTTTVLAANYVLYQSRGIVALTDGSLFTVGRQKITVAFRAGWQRQNVPPDIILAARLWSAHLFKIVKDGRVGMDSYTQGDESITFEEDGMPKVVQSLLEPWRV